MLQRFIMVFVTLLSICTAAAAQNQQPSTIRLMAPVLFGPVGTKAIQDFATEANRVLEGRALIEILPPSPAALDSIMKGEIALSVIPSDRYARFDAGRFAFFDLPFVLDDLNQVARLQQSAVGDAMLASVANEGLIGLQYWNLGLRRIFGPIENEKYLFGKQIAITELTSAVTRTALAALGMIPRTYRSVGEWIPMVVKGEIAAYYATPTFVLNNAQLREKPVNYLDIGFTPQALLVVANRRVWEGYSFQVQSALAEQARLMAARINQESSLREREALAALRQRGFRPAEDGGTLHEMRDKVSAAWTSSDSLPRNNVVTVALGGSDQYRRNPTPPAEQRERAQPPGCVPPTFFATDRKRELGTVPNLQFGRARGELVFGIAQLSCGTRPVAGTADTRIDTIDMFPEDAAFAAALSARLKRDGQTSALIYVHGYNTTFRSAIEGGAFLSSDT